VLFGSGQYVRPVPRVGLERRVLARCEIQSRYEWLAANLNDNLPLVVSLSEPFRAVERAFLHLVNRVDDAMYCGVGRIACHDVTLA
jgi:hypothetical protein